MDKDPRIDPSKLGDGLEFTGDQIAMIRKGLGLSYQQFADALFVHQNSVRKWENAKEKTLPLDARTQQLLVALREKLKREPEGASDIGGMVLKGLLIGGALAAGFLLLRALVREEDLPKPKK